MEVLEDKWKKLRLLEEEVSDIIIEDNVSEELRYKEQRSLVGRMVSSRTISREALEATMAKIWRINKAAKFMKVSMNIFVLVFENQEDKLRVWAGRPWLFDNNMLALREFEAHIPLHRISFDHESFWIRMHNLPLSCMTKERGVQIGSTVGKVEEVDVQDDGYGWGSYLRVRVYMNLTQPLARDRTLEVKGESVWVPFSYEKMPRICFSCGCIVHWTNGCCSVLEDSENKEVQYGAWLRATQFQRVKNSSNFFRREEGG
ncbi:uncharacterized protein At4g02000-like [Juglans microcarpa x Juglans regia]|uniref:uncharacterized protein At4g02000-like n=1 Tax=Juglans microcarpa x Juglans regia TaxID=2249226 RepID=UPI001B7ECC92|nr:uncharacterized protein At4g02000-like [Juglans microcarpa x Juglans regia]